MWPFKRRRKIDDWDLIIINERRYIRGLKPLTRSQANKALEAAPKDKFFDFKTYLAGYEAAYKEVKIDISEFLKAGYRGNADKKDDKTASPRFDVA